MAVSDPFGLQKSGLPLERNHSLTDNVLEVLEEFDYAEALWFVGVGGPAFSKRRSVCSRRPVGPLSGCGYA